jgi:hypothetical protein
MKTPTPIKLYIEMNLIKKNHKIVSKLYKMVCNN